MLKFIKKYVLKKSSFLRSLVWLADNLYYEYNKKDFKELGENCIIHPTCSFSHTDKLVIKNNVQIHSNAHFYCQGGLYIGSNVSIASKCLIVTFNHIFKDHSAVPYGSDIEIKPVYIHDNVWIGANVKIAPGVEIGQGAIVGMGAVITKNIKSCAIVAGNPAKVIADRNREEYERCQMQGKFVKHQYQGKNIIPEDIRNQPALYNFLKQYEIIDL